MDGPTLKFTKQQLLFKKYDARTIKVEDIEAFCDAEGIDFKPDYSAKITENLAELAKIVRKGDKTPKDNEPKAVAAEEDQAEKVEKPKADPKLPGYLARRQDKIKAEQAQLANGVGGAPITYGENAPGFLKRRFGGKA